MQLKKSLRRLRMRMHVALINNIRAVLAAAPSARVCALVEAGAAGVELPEDVVEQLREIERREAIAAASKKKGIQ